jgi:hypothetical protein
MLFSIFDCGQSENHYISVEDTTSSKRAGFLLFLSFTSQENPTRPALVFCGWSI